MSHGWQLRRYSATANRTLQCLSLSDGNELSVTIILGVSAVWQRTCFGHTGSQVQVLYSQPKKTECVGQARAAWSKRKTNSKDRPREVQAKLVKDREIRFDSSLSYRECSVTVTHDVRDIEQRGSTDIFYHLFSLGHWILLFMTWQKIMFVSVKRGDPRTQPNEVATSALSSMVRARGLYPLGPHKVNLGSSPRGRTIDTYSKF